MDSSDSRSLTALEHLMEEFFNSTTSNSRKHEIEHQLNLFKCAPNLWKLSLYFLTNTSSQYVTMYSLSILETVISQQWANSDWACREELKSILYNYLIERGIRAPHFLRGKHAKLLVDIAKQDWPHRYPNYLDNILELLRTESNQLVGLILLRTTSEEFMGLDSTLDKDRKDEISRLLYPYIPAIFQILTTILENLGTKPRYPATATPPPSPTHPSSTPNLSDQLASATFKTDNKALNKEILNTLQHLFTWVPINQISPQIIKCIFHFTNISSYAQDDDDMCVLAMSTINELLYRKCTPPGTQNFFIQLYHHTVELLRDLANSSLYRIEALDPTFVEKLTELLVLLIQQHFWRLELEPNFSAIEFLSLLFQLTVQLPSVQCYTRCLAAWVAFIKQIKPQNAHKYSEAFLGLVSMLLKKIQFSSNFSQLKHIDNYEVNDDNETEWAIFIKASNEVIAMIAEYAPLETFNQVLIPWKSQCDTYKHLGNAVNELGHILNCDVEESERLCCILRDFSTLTQTLARLSSLFTDQDVDIPDTCDDLIYCLFEKILESASTATSTKLFHSEFHNRLTQSFVDVQSQLLAALKTWLVWGIQRDKVTNQNIKTLTDVTLSILLEGQNRQTGICCSAAHLLLALTTHVLSPRLMIFQAVNDFVSVASTLKFNNIETHHLVNGAICNLLLKTWGELSQEDMALRHYVIGVFFDSLTKDFRSLNPSSDEQKVREVTDLVLPSLSHIIDFCKHFPVSSRKLLFLALRTSIEHALTVFPSYVKYSEVGQNILILFISVLGVLQQQLGLEGTKHAVNIFLQVAVSEQHITTPSNIEKLLQILKLVVETPGSSYKTFLPGILDMCMQHVCPVVLTQAEDYPEVFISLLNLFYSILLYRWQYFYMSQVRSGFSPCVNSDTEINYDNPQKPQELLNILQIFGHALLQQDINIFKLSVTALEDLNSKWNLYNKAIFRELLLYKFVAVLLEALLAKSQALLSDDMQIAIYNMASINFEDFFTTFLPQFLRTVVGISPDQCTMLLRNFLENYDKDMPTFVQRLRIFVKDAQHFRICNSR